MLYMMHKYTDISRRYRVIRATRVQRPRFIDEVRRVFVPFRLISKVREPRLGYKREYNRCIVYYKRRSYYPNYIFLIC